MCTLHNSDSFSPSNPFSIYSSNCGPKAGTDAVGSRMQAAREYVLDAAIEAAFDAFILDGMVHVGLLIGVVRAALCARARPHTRSLWSRCCCL